MKPSAIRTGLFALLIASGGVACVACGSDDDTTDTADGAATEAGLDMSCPANTPELNFGPTGLSAANEAMGVKVYLETASDRPPLNGSNDWTIAFTDMLGNPMPQANLTFACAFMQLHGHGSNPRMVENLGGGRYELVRQNMAMQGGWEIRLWVDPTGGGTTYSGGKLTSVNRTACSGPTGDPTLTLYTCVPR
jgi:hypothetical protein